MIETLLNTSPFSEYRARRTKREFESHNEVSNNNFFWMMEYIKRHQNEIETKTFEENGFYFKAGVYRRDLRTTGNAFVGSSKCVKIDLIQPSKIETIGINTRLEWDDYHYSKERISSYICVINRSKPESEQRIGDMSGDQLIRKPRGKDVFEVNNLFLDGNDDKFGLNTGVLTPNVEMVLRSAYRVMYDFLRFGHLGFNDKTS